ncbi:MAG TPA: dihydroorotase [Nitrospiria bacterium]|nr:dihydroorotase [Nitrospiria bacterium]
MTRQTDNRSILIRGGRVIDPASGLDAVCDLEITDGRITACGSGLKPAAKTDSFNATGLVVCPGLIDLHTHVREPGYEYKETIKTATAAAAAGGFTTVFAMPNTNPINDTRAVTELVLDVARRDGAVNVEPVGAITKGSKGEELAEIGELVAAGCAAISDDGRPVTSSLIMRRALEYTLAFNVPVIDHCEDLCLSSGGVMHEGKVSTMLGLKGVPAAAETVMVARDLALAELTGGRLHLAHMSCAASVRMIREAKARGVRVTAEACPHHFSLTDEAVIGFKADAKMNPPLRTREDVLAVIEGLADGTIDAIATDHAPHAPEEKSWPIAEAPFGVVGLETALALSLALTADGHLSLPQVIALLTSKPAAVMGSDRGGLRVGAPADVTVFDPEAEWVVDPAQFRSKSRNTPFAGWKMRGRVIRTIVGGKVVYDASA